jgi:hypothetical protein
VAATKFRGLLVCATLPRARRRRPSWPRSVLATGASLLPGGPAIAAPAEALGYPMSWTGESRSCGGGERAIRAFIYITTKGRKSFDGFAKRTREVIDLQRLMFSKSPAIASLASCEGISQPAREHWPGGRELCKRRPVVILSQLLHRPIRSAAYGSKEMTIFRALQRERV